MLRLLLNYAKKALLILLVGLLITGGTVYSSNKNQGATNAMAYSTTCSTRQCDIVLRVGEYPNKPGKRIYCDNIKWKLIPTDLPIRKDDNGKHYIAEYDINNKITTAIYKKLEEKGVSTTILRSSNKSEDLNAAGRKSNTLNPHIYFSVHTNYYDRSDASGYFMMYNQGDQAAKEVADRLSDSIKHNMMIYQRDSVAQNGYIGELNAIHDSTIGVLLEGGFFSGIEGNGDLYYLVSDDYCNYLADKLSDELIQVLNELK